ncbi:MAG: TolC family protein [Planctomycetia bacterium]|nr:TolC family protein [Planctomycetia bacterium]
MNGNGAHSSPGTPARFANGLKFGLLAALCLAATGCPRQYWRKQADELSYNLVRDKQNDPRWATDRIRVETDPRSRFFDCYDPDFAPLPPDDLAAHEFMHWAYGKRGWKHWHEFGDAQTVENPKWLEPLGMSAEVVESNMGRPGLYPELKLTMEDAIDLSYIHSRDYQTQIENVYLSALSLTLQRFAFDVQFVGLNGRRPSSDVTMTDVPGVSDSVNWNPRAGVSQLLPTGGQWLVELANNTLWLFASGDHSSSTASTLSYSLVQPLLANGGRRFVMENLTQSERNLLYAVRDLARFRQGFFASTVAGGFTAGISVGQPGVFTGGPTIPTSIAAFPGAGGNGGFLGLLQLYQQVANAEYNLRMLREQIDRLRAQAAERPERVTTKLDALPAGLVFPPAFAGRIDYDDEDKVLVLRGSLNDVDTRLLLDLSNDPAYREAILDLADRSSVITINQNIAQLETQLAGQINNLRTSRAGYLSGLDSFKLQVGLPVDMPVSIDTSMLKPFELIDPRLVRLQDRLNSFVPEAQFVSPDHPDFETMSRVASLMRDLISTKELQLDVLRKLVDEMLIIQSDLKRDGIDVTEDDFRRAAEHRAKKATQVQIDSGMGGSRDPRRDEKLKKVLLDEFAETEKNLLELKQKLAQPDADRQAALEAIADLREDLLKISQSLSVVQSNLRVDMIELNPFDIPMEDAVAFGLGNRLDLMNARAAVMDNRRKVEVAANQLQSVVNLVATGQINTKGLGDGNNNPFEFRGDKSNFQVGITFTTPVQLVAQRNTYRAAIIGYNQARRNYMRTEDQVKLDIRQTWRTLDVNRRNFETLREQLRAATAQLDIAAEQTSAPAGAVPAGGAPGGGGGGGAAGAAQGLQIIQAVTSVLNAQNSLIQFWVNYEAFRLDIFNFMGTLEVDQEGYWTDEFYQMRARAHRANPNRLYPPLENPAGDSSSSDAQELNNARLVEKNLLVKKSAPSTGATRAGEAKPAAPGRVRLASAEEPAKEPTDGLRQPPRRRGEGSPVRRGADPGGSGGAGGVARQPVQP